MTFTGNVVEEFTIGNTRVKICDDYCRDKTPSEVEAILARIAETVREPLIAAEEAARGKEGSEGKRKSDRTGR